MSSEPQGPNPNADGQAQGAPWAQGQASSAPEPQGGQAQAPHGPDPGQAQSTQATAEPSFFDPNQVPPELLPAYKQMQAAFTTKTQDIARHRQKIEAYDAFMRDPVGQLQNLAAQYGLHLTRAQAAQQLQQTQAQAPQKWEPQTWDEVMPRSEADRLLAEAEERVLHRLAPYLGQVQQMQAGAIEQQLASIDPNWREYEGAMRHLLQTHPTLVNDVGMLYRMAVPPQVLEAKAIQQALKRVEGKAQHQNVTQTGSAPRSKPAPAKISSWDDAVQEAKRKLISGEA